MSIQFPFGVCVREGEKLLSIKIDSMARFDCSRRDATTRCTKNRILETVALSQKGNPPSFSTYPQRFTHTLVFLFSFEHISPTQKGGFFLYLFQQRLPESSGYLLCWLIYCLTDLDQRNKITRDVQVKVRECPAGTGQDETNGTPRV